MTDRVDTEIGNRWKKSAAFSTEICHSPDRWLIRDTEDKSDPVILPHRM